MYTGGNSDSYIENLKKEREVLLSKLYQERDLKRLMRLMDIKKELKKLETKKF